jgi:hypothetical protein
MCQCALSDSLQPVSQVKPESKTEQTNSQANADSSKDSPYNSVVCSPSLVCSSSSPSSETKNNNGYETTQETYFLGMKLSELLMIVVTLIVAGATIYLYMATKDLVKSGENTAKRQLRAYLSFHCNVYDGHIRFTVLNYGQTPAKRCVNYITHSDRELAKDEILSNFFKRNDEWSSTGQFSANIFKDQKDKVIDVTPRFLFRDATYTTFPSKLFINGLFEYYDVFEERHITMFQFFIEKNGVQWIIMMCKQGNEIT